MDKLHLPGVIWPLHLVSHLAEHLLWMRLQGRADATLYARRRAMVRLAEYLQGDPLHATYDQLYAWQVHLLATSTTLVRWSTALIRPYYGWCHLRGLRPDNPAALLPIPRAPRGLPRPIAEEDLRTAVCQARPRLVPWLLLAGWCGLRACEIARLRVEDVMVAADHQIWLRVLGKGSRVRHVPVPDWAWPTIVAGMAPSGWAWRRERGTGRVTAQHVSQYTNGYLRGLGLLDTFHALRHRTATRVYEQTGDLYVVADLLGHTSLDTTRIYTRVASGRIAAAVNALPPVELPRLRHLHAVPHTRGATS